MTTLTLAAIKAEHAKVAEMIAAFETQAKVEAAFPINVTFPKLNAGETYVGSIISADGSRRYHLILLPGQIEKANWKKAMDWAASIGGELPDRVESALLFATLKDQFKPEWHWTREQHASDSGYAWGQGFDNGHQYYSLKSFEGRARAVRRLEIL